MKTIEEVKSLLDFDINWSEILKDVVLQKFGENKLISVSNGAFSHLLGVENTLELVAVIVSNEKLFGYCDNCDDCGYSDGFVFGLLETNYNTHKHNHKKNVYVLPNALKEFTRKLIYGKDDDIIIEYDFNNEVSKEERDFMPFEYISHVLIEDDMFYNKTKEILKNGIGYISY